MPKPLHAKHFEARLFEKYLQPAVHFRIVRRGRNHPLRSHRLQPFDNAGAHGGDGQPGRLLEHFG